MSVYQVEEYYVYVEFGTNKDFELIHAALKSLMENHDIPHDYELNEATITVDDFKSERDAQEFESEILAMIKTVSATSD